MRDGKEKAKPDEPLDTSRHGLQACDLLKPGLGGSSSASRRPAARCTSWRSSSSSLGPASSEHVGVCKKLQLLLKYAPF